MRHRLLVLLLAVAVAVAACAASSDVAGGDDEAPEVGTDLGGTGGDGSEDPAACPTDAGLAEVPPLHPSVDDYPQTTIELVSPDGACTISLAVRVADTHDRRSHGLMEVPEVPDGTGMLFTYGDVDGPRTGGYWMKGTLVPLDIAYVSRGGVVVDLLAMQPCRADPCPTYPPDTPYRATLEVSQGWFEDVGVGEGWSLRPPPP